VAPPGDAVDVFTMPDERMVCPHFDHLKLASNGCFYRCDWCYLKLTYRAAYPFITVRAGLEVIKDQIRRRLGKAERPVMFNSGELADSLSMEHLTGAARELIPWFGRSGNGYLFMLTKSDNVDGILDLEHNGHTVVAWSMNAPKVSRKFELGAPSFERRLAAAVKVQKAGYPVRIRLGPIVPLLGWREQYAETIRRIFEVVNPERVTLGTLRFEPGFSKGLFTTGDTLLRMVERMEPMFEPMEMPHPTKPGKTKTSTGKDSFPEDERAELFQFAIAEIRKYSDCRIALCKESASVWERVGLQLSRCSCVCQLDYADMQ
jgi:spore photoproduct lyase